MYKNSEIIVGDQSTDSNSLSFKQIDYTDHE